MLDLQNAVEEIGAASMGQAWVVVTSQEKNNSCNKHDKYKGFFKNPRTLRYTH